MGSFIVIRSRNKKRFSIFSEILNPLWTEMTYGRIGNGSILWSLCLKVGDRDCCCIAQIAKSMLSLAGRYSWDNSNGTWAREGNLDLLFQSPRTLGTAWLRSISMIKNSSEKEATSLLAIVVVIIRIPNGDFFLSRLPGRVYFLTVKASEIYYLLSLSLSRTTICGCHGAFLYQRSVVGIGVLTRRKYILKKQWNV